MANALDELGKLAERDILPSRTTAVKEQQRVECGRNVTSVSVGRISLDDPPRLLLYVSMVCGAEDAGEGNRPSAPDIAVTFEL
jgi:hypothetical protein